MRLVCPGLVCLLFKREGGASSVRERATVALANLQRNAYAMGVLRSRIESRINFILSESAGGKSGNGGEYQELARVLELVKNSELILNELSGKIESARFLEEFITIIDSAASSVSGIKGDVESLVPVAENALQEMHDAISRISGGLYTEPVQPEVQQKILDEAERAATAAAEGEKRPSPAAAVIVTAIAAKPATSAQQQQKEGAGRPGAAVKEGEPQEAELA